MTPATLETLKDLPDWIEADPAWGLRLKQAIDALPQPLTYAEFLDRIDEDTLAEWVDGEVIMTSPANAKHQQLANFLSRIMSPFVEQNRLGVILPAPFQMKLENSGREPDLLFIAAEHLHRLQKTYLDGPADLVIEIISPESAGRDRGDKFYEYAQGRVPEYWLIDPQQQWAEFYHLKGTRYHTALSAQAGQYRSVSLPDFWLRVEWLWQDPLPAVDDILLEIGGEAYAQRWIERLKQKGFLI